MAKLLQNKIAESKLTLPVTALYALTIWLLCGVAAGRWWLQLGCFAISTYLMMELNNVHVLIRIYSRMVSSAFLVLSCAACFLFPSWRVAVLTICFVAFLLIWFLTYQEKQAPGTTYYAFLFLGLATFAFPQVIFFLPVLWLLMATNLLSLSWRNWAASLLALLTPYWFWGCWLLYQQDFTPLVSHLASIADFQQVFDIDGIPHPQLLTLLFLMLLTVIGSIHFLHKSYNDKIRIRMFYAIFIWIDLLAMAFILLQPQHFDLLLPIVIVTTAPLVGHYLALTSTRFTNITFFTILLLAGGLTLYHLWNTSYLF